MTNGEAIEILRKIALYVPTGVIEPSDFYLTIALAIEALEEKTQGEWKLISMGLTYKYQCSVCGRTIETTPMFLPKYPYCHCGAKMKGGAENDT